MKLLDIFKRSKKEVAYDLTKASRGLTNEMLVNYNKVRVNGPQNKACYAPFKSLYFGHHGKAVVCCYNRDYTLGTYPDSSINDIWFSEKAETLRTAISSNDFSYGCDGCLSQIMAGNFDATKAKQYDERGFNTNRYPSVIEFELDNTCNLECIMCSGDFSSLIRANREKREALSIPYDDKFVEQLADFIPYLEEVKFYGGEPFLIEIYYKIIDLIIKIKPSIFISIQTNGTVLNNRVKSILAKANVHLNISIDSLEKENYESIRVNAKFERVMENVEYFYKYCLEKNTFFGISVCGMRQNWHELPNFVRFCNDKGIPLYIHTVFFPKQQALRTLAAEEIREIHQTLLTVLPSLPAITTVEAKNKLHFEGFLKQMTFWYAKANEPIQKPLSSIEDMIEFVEVAIANMTPLRAEYYAAHQEEIIGKLTQIKTALPIDYDYKPIFESVNYEFSVLDTIIEKSHEELLSILQSM